MTILRTVRKARHRAEFRGKTAPLRIILQELLEHLVVVNGHAPATASLLTLF